ncbi:MAG: BON domain-containing protein, partial [Gemmatimonadales bacterium]
DQTNWDRSRPRYEADYGFPQSERGYWEPARGRSDQDDWRRNAARGRQGGGYGSNRDWSRNDGEEDYGSRGRWGDDRSGQGGYRLGTYDTPRGRYRDSWYGGGYLGAGSYRESGDFDETARRYAPRSTEISYHAPEHDGGWPRRQPFRGPHTGKGPRGYQRSDERIREDVCEQLHRDGDIDASDVDIEVRNGEVTLSGTVPERRMKQMAEECAVDCTGVRDVQNSLRVRPAGVHEERETTKARKAAGRRPRRQPGTAH